MIKLTLLVTNKVLSSGHMYPREEVERALTRLSADFILGKLLRSTGEPYPEICAYFHNPRLEDDKLVADMELAPHSEAMERQVEQEFYPFPIFSVRGRDPVEDLRIESVNVMQRSTSPQLSDLSFQQPE